MNALFYGFQFSHHGQSTGFRPMARAMKPHVRVMDASPPSLSFLSNHWKIRAEHNGLKLSEYRLKRHLSRPDGLTHYFFPENTLMKGATWKHPDHKLVLTCHQPVESVPFRKLKINNPGFFEGLRAADAVVLMASNELDAYRELAPNAQIVCVPHGVDIRFFSPAPAAPNSTGKFRVLTVGNWLRDYGLWAKTVEAFSQECPNAEFSVLANPDRLAAATKKMGGTQENIRILRGISDEQLRDEYRRADLIFLPLIDAWANNALLESMSCGRPLLVTDLPATREYAGDAACFMQKSSPEDAVEKLMNLHQNPQLRLRLGRHARALMAAKFAWEQIALRQVELYDHISFS